ncbi:MAG: penicillin-binding transpeptidase domain-containing protein [Acidimicrobiales bacterium]
MNRQIKHVVIVLLGCFVILFVQLNRIQVYDVQSLEENPANNRTIQRDFDRPRGKILTSDGVIVAQSEPTPGKFFAEQRVYPHGDLYAHVAGYTSFTFGAQGVERVYNDELIGRTAAQELSGLTDLLSGTNPIGDVRLSLRDDVQRAAKAALGERRGSVVALDPVTGEIFAMWTYPSFDPTQLANNDGSVANTAWTELVNADGNPLLAKAYRDIFFPGSTFKVITAAAALDGGAITTTAPEFDVVESYTPPLTERPIANFGGSSCGGNLIELLVVSCNTAFAQIGAELVGPSEMIAAAERFGFNQIPPIDLPVAVDSEFPLDFGSEVDAATPAIPAGVFEATPVLAQSAIGQNSVSATPLQMALVAAAVANAGQVPVPHVMLAIEDSESQRQTSSFRNETWLRAMSSETAAELTSAMIQVVERGSARNLAIPDLVIGAKTGTAQLGTDPPQSHAWVTAFGGRANERARLAVAVLVEGTESSSDQTGGGVAAPIAREVFEAFFE